MGRAAVNRADRRAPDRQSTRHCAGAGFRLLISSAARWAIFGPGRGWI